MTTVYQQPTDRARVVINIPLDEWVTNDGLDNPGDQLHYGGTFTINNVPMHLEAIRVNKRPEDGSVYTQEAEGPELTEGFNALWAVTGADGPLRPWTALNGEHYILVLTPHTD